MSCALQSFNLDNIYYVSLQAMIVFGKFLVPLGIYSTAGVLQVDLEGEM